MEDDIVKYEEQLRRTDDERRKINENIANTVIEKRRLILDESENEDMDENGSSDNEAVEVSQEGSASASASYIS